MRSAMAILFVMALSCFCHNTRLEAAGIHKNEMPERNDLTVSLITCYPGEEIYELCGHSAVRIRGNGIDSVWNFGIFDFNQPNFVYRFVKGETDYKGASYPFSWFMPEYIHAGRKVVEQDLNFTPEEATAMLEVLREAVQPENATYRYNYIKDNCSTRILNHMDSASSSAIIYPDSVRYGSFRNEMRAYHKGYPWYQLGIDLALGSGLDGNLDARGEMFVPVEMMRNAASARFSDGRPLVKATRVLNEGHDATLPPTPWFLAPVFWAWLLALSLIWMVTDNILHKRLFLAVYGVWFFILGLVGCLIAFLVFISVHESTSPNVLILWLNPVQFLFVVALANRNLRILAKTMAWYNILVTGGLLLLYPFYEQSFNAAFFPLMLATFAMGCAYAIIRNKQSYKRR